MMDAKVMGIDILHEALHRAEVLIKDLNHFRKEFAQLEDKGDPAITTFLNQRDGNPLLNLVMFFERFSSDLSVFLKTSIFPADQEGIKVLNDLAGLVRPEEYVKRSLDLFINLDSGSGDVARTQKVLISFFHDYETNIRRLAAEMSSLLSDVMVVYNNIFDHIKAFAARNNVFIDGGAPRLMFSISDEVKEFGVKATAYYWPDKPMIELKREFFTKYGSLERSIVLAHEIFHHVHHQSKRKPWVLPRIGFTERGEALRNSAGPCIKLIKKVSRERTSLYDYTGFLGGLGSSLARMSKGISKDRKLQSYFENRGKGPLLDTGSYSGELERCAGLLLKYSELFHRHIVEPFVKMTDHVVDFYDIIDKSENEDDYNSLYHRMPQKITGAVSSFVSETRKFKIDPGKFLKPIYNSLKLLFLEKDSVEVIDRWAKYFFGSGAKLLEPESSDQEFSRQANMLYKMVRSPLDFFAAYFRDAANDSVDADLAAGLVLCGDAARLTRALVDGFNLQLIEELEKTYNEGMVDYLAYKFILEHFKGRKALSPELIKETMLRKDMGYPTHRMRIFKNRKLRNRIGFAHFMVLMAQHMGYIKLVH